MTIPQIAYKNLRRKPARTMLLFGIVSVVSCALFSAALLLTGVNNALKTGMSRLGADILVVPEHAETAARTALLTGDPTHFLMHNEVLADVKKIDGVKRASSQIFIKPAAFTCCYDVDVFLIAFDPESDFTIKPWIEQELKRRLDADEIIAGKDLPALPGDRIPFFGTYFRIAATMAPTGMDFFDRAVFFTVEAAYRMSEDSGGRARQPIIIGRDKISSVLVQVKEDIPPERVAIRIEYGIRGVKAIVADTIIHQVKKQISGLSSLVVFGGALLWLALLIILAFTFYMIVNERRKELGLLCAMGANKRHVAAIILSEASMLTMFGGAFGIALGYALLAGMEGVLLEYLRLPYLLPSPAQLTLPVLSSFILSIVTGIASALLPCIAVIKMEPFEAIRD